MVKKAKGKRKRKAVEVKDIPASPGLFRCVKCGACCTMLGPPKERISRDDNGVFYAIEQGSTTLEIWPWEAERLRVAAEELEIVIAIKPCMFIVDGMDGAAIVISYYLKHKECPFYDPKKKLCRTHDMRPLTCRSYPMYGHRTGVGISHACPFIVPLDMTLDPEKNGLLIQAVYRDEVEHLFKDMDIYRKLFGLIRDLDDNGVIQWGREAKAVLAARYLKEHGVDLLDLIRNKGIMDEKELEDAISVLESMKGVREALEVRIDARNVRI